MPWYSPKKRTPSYTDRILWKESAESDKKTTESTIQQKTYSSHMSYVLSDHKPISGEFIVNIPVRNLFLKSLISTIGKL